MITSPLSSPSSAALCRHFLAGKCRWGDDCKFSHTVPTSSATSDTTGSIGAPRHLICHYDARGVRCPFGQFCVFLHTSPQNVVVSPTSLSSSMSFDSSYVGTYGQGVVGGSPSDEAPFPHPVSEATAFVADYVNTMMVPPHIPSSESLGVSYFAEEAQVSHRMMAGWKKALIEERCRLWKMATVDCDYTVVIEKDETTSHDVYVLSFHSHHTVERFEVPAITDPKGLVERGELLPRRHALWLVGDYDLFWNCVVLFFCGDRTCGIPWIDELFEDPLSVLHTLEQIDTSDLLYFRTTCVRPAVVWKESLVC